MILIYLIGILVVFVLFTLAAFLAGEEVTVEDLITLLLSLEKSLGDNGDKIIFDFRRN